MIKGLLTALLIFPFTHTNAQPGALDNTFGVGGIVLKTLESSAQYAGIAFQQDGKLICAGTQFSDSEHRPILTRYKENGETDSCFGLNGTAVFASFVSPYMEINEVVAPSNGKIFVAGAEYDQFYALQDFFIAKYKADGTADSSFNGNGIVRTNLGVQPFGELGNILVQADGKVIITGYAYNELYESSFIAVRYHSNGTPDNGFGDNGIVVIAPGNNGDNRSISAALQPDGKILFAGAIDFEVDPAHGDFAFVRLNPDGTPDNGFGNNGVVILDNAGLTDLPLKVIVQQDGKIVACGTSSEGSVTPTYRSVLLRLNADGTKDSGFGNGGIVFSLLSDFTSFMFDVAVQDDGKLVCAGSVYSDGMVFSGGKKSVLLARFNPDGTPDNSLNGTGHVITAIETNGNAEASALALFHNRIYIAGQSFSETSFESAFVAAYRQKDIVLPLSVLNFSATRKDNTAQLLWQTVSQQDVTRYIVERSENGLQFKGVGSVAATAGSGSASYNFADLIPTGKDVFYRLQILDNDGKFTYSKTIRLAGSENVYSMKVYPNPARDVLQVMVNGMNETAVLSLIDVNGRMMKQMKQQFSVNTTVSVDIQQLPPGVYTLAIYGANGLKQQRFVKF